MEIDTLGLSEWDEILPDSGYEVFHRSEALAVLERHTPNTELILYVGYKGREPKALMPVFIRDLPLGGRIVSSPPPGRHVPYLGPIIMPSSSKQRKQESLNRQFTEGVLSQFDFSHRTFLYLNCSPGYDDPRPFDWADQSVTVSFTYTLDIADDVETVLKAFSKSRRREITNGRQSGVTVDRGGIEEVRAVYEQTSDRFSEQFEYFGLTWPFVSDLFEALDDAARVYVARGPAGDYLSGIICLYSGDSAYFWLGGVRADYDNVSVNSLLHWRIIQDIVEDPELKRIDGYDLVGAGEYRLTKYKSKFNPSLQPYYVVNSGGPKMKIAKMAYETITSVRSRAEVLSSLF